MKKTSKNATIPQKVTPLLEDKQSIKSEDLNLPEEQGS